MEDGPLGNASNATSPPSAPPAVPIVGVQVTIGFLYAATWLIAIALLYRARRSLALAPSVAAASGACSTRRQSGALFGFTAAGPFSSKRACTADVEYFSEATDFLRRRVFLTGVVPSAATAAVGMLVIEAPRSSANSLYLVQREGDTPVVHLRPRAAPPCACG